MSIRRRRQNIGALKLYGSYRFIMVYNLRTRTASSRKVRAQITLSNTLFLCRKAQRRLLHWNLNVKPEECQENKFNPDLLRAADCIDYLQWKGHGCTHKEASTHTAFCWHWNALELWQDACVCVRERGRKGERGGGYHRGDIPTLLNARFLWREFILFAHTRVGRGKQAWPQLS